MTHSIPDCKGNRLGYIKGCQCLLSRVDAANYAAHRRAVRKTGGYIYGKLISLGVEYM